MWFELWVAEFDLAAAGQEDAEEDVIGVGRELGGDLMPGPVAGSGDGGEVVGGILSGWLPWRGPIAGDAEQQSGAVGDAGDAQVAAEGDGAVLLRPLRPGRCDRPARGYADSSGIYQTNT
jgi:hypothetical protein